LHGLNLQVAETVATCLHHYLSNAWGKSADNWAAACSLLAADPWYAMRVGGWVISNKAEEGSNEQSWNVR